jgi:hypothetical protein
LRDAVLAAVSARVAAGESTGLELDAARIANRQARALADGQAARTDARPAGATLGLPAAGAGGVDFAWEDFADPVPEAPVPITPWRCQRARPRRCAARGGRL